MSFFIIKRFNFLNLKVCRKGMCLFFCVIVLVMFLKFMMKKFENKISILVIKLNRRKVFLPTCINKNVNVTQSINKQDQNC